jgi:hypothetical protein
MGMRRIYSNPDPHGAHIEIGHALTKSLKFVMFLKLAYFQVVAVNTKFWGLKGIGQVHSEHGMCARKNSV